MLNTEQPFRLNWAAFSTGDRRPNTGGNGVMLVLIVSIFVGDLLLMTDGNVEPTHLLVISSALSKVLRADELYYLEKQFGLLSPDANAGITLETIKMALMKSATDAMKESRILDFLDPLNTLGYRKMHRDEFCAAALSVHQMEIVDGWEERARSAYAIFERDGNRAILIQELASELGLSPTVPIHAVLQEHIRHSDGKLTLQGFLRLLHTLQPCSPAKDTVRATIEFRITMGIQNLPFG
ncbi:CDPK-related protein kinase-like [Salvia splendens]|uniref:CDPK-related protein kinase-like n=1 Tax=Salvia splendens TaxID=180675 RepID=UPI001C280F0A|nr:CDPK-related protein kinase-like [Salvia splendens]